MFAECCDEATIVAWKTPFVAAQEAEQRKAGCVHPSRRGQKASHQDEAVLVAPIPRGPRRHLRAHTEERALARVSQDGASVSESAPAVTGRRSIARMPGRLRQAISDSPTASVNFGQRRNRDFSAHRPSMRASWWPRQK